MSDKAAIFCRVVPAELNRMDAQARVEMRSRTNWAMNELAKVVSGMKPPPAEYPEAPGDGSVVLFLRVPPEMKFACNTFAQSAGVPLSRWIRAVLV